MPKSRARAPPRLPVPVAFFLKIGGIFFQIGGNGANVLVEFEKKILTGGIFFKIGGKKLFWDRENQLFWELY